jgi:polyisoprenoid-binding protein YceI
MANFQIQKSSSTINWTGKKVLGLHTGTINVADGYIDFSEEGIKNGEVVIDMTTIVITDIDDPKTNGEFLAHLQNDDFFSVAKFKTAKLLITDSAKKVSNTFLLKGNLIIKDITNPVSFTATVEVFTDFLHSMGEIVIDRTLYNIRYGSGKFLQNLGDSLIYDDFVLQFKLIAQKTN